MIIDQIANRRAAPGLAIAGAVCLLSVGAAPTQNDPPNSPPVNPTLDETRLTMSKWIETQRIISTERNEWQHGKEILLSRIELVKKEVESLELKLKEAESSVEKATAEKTAIDAEHDQLKAGAAQLTHAVAAMETDIRRLYAAVPRPAKEKIQPLYDRIPEPESKKSVAVAERYQNVLGILNELNKLNNEITVSYEVHVLADGKSSEVKAIYVGLAQAYYVSAKGDAGIGRPGQAGWTWQPSNAVANDVLKSLEILQGTHTPAFVPLPVEIQ